MTVNTNDIRRDDGAIALIVAISLVLLFAMAALAVDLGLWMTAKRQMQSAADGAALAGCRRLADGADDATIWATVTDYATRNFTVPVNAADSVVVQPTPGGASDIGDNYVKVTVRTASPSFFARVIGHNQGLVAAQSVASVGYLAGGRAPVPWGLTVLHISDMSATMGAHQTQMWDSGGGNWVGGFSQGSFGSVTLRATNEIGYTEEFPGVVTVGYLPATDKIAAVHLDKTTFTSGVDSTIRVEVTPVAPLAPGGKVSASAGGALRALALDSSTGRYVGTLNMPTTAEPFITVPIKIELTEGKLYTQTVESRVLLRRANYILENVELEPAFAGPGDSVNITVKTLEFEYGRTYQLKVEGGTGTTGNFLALDFASSSLDHSLCGYPNTPISPGGHGGSDYSDFIVGDPNLILHINDLVDTKTGDMVGPTKSGISERLSGVTMLTFAQWEAAGKPDTKQLLLVPITEKVEDLTGKSQLKVISFATFFLEAAPQGSKDPVVGRFIEYTAPGWVVTPNPPGPLAIKAVHLVSDHLDF